MKTMWHLDTRGVREEYIRGHFNKLEAIRLLVTCGFTTKEATKHINSLDKQLELDLQDAKPSTDNS